MQQIIIEKSLSDELGFYKQQVKKLQIQLSQSQKQLKLLKKQQDKIRDLEKINFDTSTRLLQCVSNVRDLLHSNKNLRLELQIQRKSKEQAQKHILMLEEKLSQLQNKNINLIIQKVPQTNQEQEQSIQLKNKPRNIHKLTKIQKFSKLKLSQNNKNQQNIDFLDTSPIKKGKSALEKLNKNIKVHNFHSSQKFELLPKKNRKLVKSHDEKKEQKQYEKAQLRRKLSLRQSQNRLQTLQYRP